MNCYDYDGRDGVRQSHGLTTLTAGKGRAIVQ